MNPDKSIPTSRITMVALAALTLGTGLVDAATVLGAEVFAANMTGNITFLGFALGGAHQYAVIPSAAAMGGFVLGAFATGRLVPGDSRPDHAARALILEAVLLVVGTVLAATWGLEEASSLSSALVLAFVGAAMGVQNVFSLAQPVSDMKTTVMTLTVASAAADLARGKRDKLGLRALSVLCLLVGALGGALLFYRFGIGTALALAALLTLVAAVLLGRQGRTPPEEGPTHGA